MNAWIVLCVATLCWAKTPVTTEFRADRYISGQSQRFQASQRAWAAAGAANDVASFATSPSVSAGASVSFADDSEADERFLAATAWQAQRSTAAPHTDLSPAQLLAEYRRQHPDAHTSPSTSASITQALPDHDASGDHDFDVQAQFFPFYVNVYFCNLFASDDQLHVVYQDLQVGGLYTSRSVGFKECTKMIALPRIYNFPPVLRLYKDAVGGGPPTLVRTRNDTFIKGYTAENILYAFEPTANVYDLTLPLVQTDTPAASTQFQIGNYASNVPPVYILRNNVAVDPYVFLPGESVMYYQQAFGGTANMTWRYQTANNVSAYDVFSSYALINVQVPPLPAQSVVIHLVGRLGDSNFPLSLFVSNTVLMTQQYDAIAHANDPTQPLSVLNGTWTGVTKWANGFFYMPNDPSPYMRCLGNDNNDAVTEVQPTRWTFDTLGADPVFHMEADQIQFTNQNVAMQIPSVFLPTQLIFPTNGFSHGCLRWIDPHNSNFPHYLRVRFQNNTAGVPTFVGVECPVFTSNAEESWLAGVCPELADYPEPSCVPEPYSYVCIRFEFTYGAVGSTGTTNVASVSLLLLLLLGLSLL